MPFLFERSGIFMKKRYLTKSRFKLGLECPTKLYYTKKKEYLDTKMDDSFLASLGEGGYQVGELAKCYHPGGYDVNTLDYEEAESQTAELLVQDKVTIFEPAIKFQNLFVRIDVLIKNKNHFDLIEVKAKSFDDSEEDAFFNKNGSIVAGWKPYLYDIAFQRHVLSSAFPKAKISSFLMMADKNVVCGVDGLNQKFRIVRDDGNRKGIKVSNLLTKEDLKEEILIKVPVDNVIDSIFEDGEFLKIINEYSTAYEQDKKIVSGIGSHCAGCEFSCSEEEESKGFKNGFKECWKAALKWSDADFKDENILEIWNSRKKDQYIADDKLKLTDLDIDDVEPKTDKKSGMSASERQWLQIEKVQRKEKTPFFDKEGLALEMEKWKFPLHFIDFETTMVAIPFNKGRRPYEQVAFQFSRHTIQKDGTMEHAGQYLDATPGKFPNYDFLRELKKQLEKNEGSIFRYSPHENTVLNQIYCQLMADKTNIPDKDDLCKFIKTITVSTGSSVEKWSGSRAMIDLWHLVKRHYYDPHTHGSNSIKAVLPAVLNSSEYLKNKYSKAIYGAEGGIKSLNFKNWQWLEMKDGEVVDPYKKLPKLFQDITDRNFTIMSQEDELNNGGGALTAYGRMQFSEMSEMERKELSSALLRYCELDTLAMVMIYEAWREWLK
jgi:hypothetical protein